MNFGFSLLWLAVLLVAILFEVRTSDVVAIWFMPAAAIAAILSFFTLAEDDVTNLVYQIIAFLFVSVISFLIFKISFNKKIRYRKKNRTNITALLGQRCKVVEDISNVDVKGLVNINGSLWSARCVDDNDYIEADTIVVVERVEGVKLVCSREK